MLVVLARLVGWAHGRRSLHVTKSWNAVTDCALGALTKSCSASAVSASQRIREQHIVDFPVPQAVEEFNDGGQFILKENIKEAVKVVKLTPHERVL